MTNEDVLSIVSSFLSAKEAGNSVWIKEKIIQNGKWVLETVEIKPTEIIINSSINIVGKRVIREKMEDGTTVIVDGFYDQAMGDIFSFDSKEELESRLPCNRVLVYNEDGFGCVSTGKAGEAAGSLIVKNGTGFKELPAGGWTVSNPMELYK